MCHYGVMGLEGLQAIFRRREASDNERSAILFDRISRVFWLLANNPRAFKVGPTWEEISPADLESLGEKEIEESLRKDVEVDSGVKPRVYSDIEENEAFVAIGLGANRLKFLINGGKPQLIQETRTAVGVWEEKEGGRSEISWNLIEKIVSFVEQVPQRRLLHGSGPP